MYRRQSLKEIFSIKNMMKILTKTQDILLFLKQNTVWISAFATGEGCFTASIVISERAMWGFWPQLTFSITQSLLDADLLKACKEFYGGVGEVYDKKNGIGVYAVRSVTDLVNTIVPYFDQYPPLGRKAVAYGLWKELLTLVSSQAHVGNSLATRDVLVKYLTLVKKLNACESNASARKLKRYDVVIDWLNQLKTAPTTEQKLQLKKLLKDLNF